MAKTNYQFEKRQRDLAKKRRQEEKRQRKLAAKAQPEGAGSETSPALPESDQSEAADAPAENIPSGGN